MPRTSDDSADQPIGFGQFLLYPAARILKKDLDTVNIGGRAFDLLLALLRQPNEIVTKRELFESVWPNVNVDDVNLRIQINNLRKALGDGKGEASYIRNVAGRVPSTANVPASTAPAEVITPPVADRPVSAPVRAP